VARRRSRRRLAITALVMAFVGAVVGLAVTGNGEPASALRLLTGGAWLDNSSTGTVSHVEGYTGGTDAQASVGKPGDPFEVVQRASGAYVLDLRTGRLSRLDDATLNVATATAEPGPAGALQVVAGSSTTWVLDRSSGILQQLNPTTLAPVGRQIALGGPTGAATVDGSGSIWVPVPTRAGVEQANPADVVTGHPFGRTGDAVQVADTSGGVWAVDPESATAASLQEPSLHQVALPAMHPATPPVVGASSSSPDLVVLAGSEVLDIDTSRPALSSLELPAASQSTQVAVASNRAYLLDGPAGELDAVQLAPLRALAPIRVPRGADQLVTQDQLVFVNTPGTPQALVVNGSGSVTSISKYQPAAPTSAKKRSAGGRSVASPTLSPNAAGGAPGRTPPGGGNPATSPPISPPTTSPPTTGPPPSVTPPTQPPPTPSPTTQPPTSQPPTVPGAPAVTQVNAGDGVLTVGWSPPVSNGGSPIVKYQVTATPSGARLSAGGTATSATLSGQPDGVRECVQVQAVNAVGGGPLSPAGQSCATPLKDSPGQVTGVQASATAAGQISLSWRQPSLGPYHTPIANYTVRGGPAVRTVTTTQAVVKGLAAGTAYSFTIVATNTKGNTGPASAPVRATTWSKPSAVSNLTVTGGDGQLTISWSAAKVPSGSPAVTGYQVSVGGSTSSTSSTSFSKSVPAWTNETVSVYAVNAVGNGPSTKGIGTAWARSGTVLCHDVLSGDVAIENSCPAPGGAWVDEGASSINWISYPVPSGGHPAGPNEYLCTTYYTGSVSGDRYALVTTPTDTACTKVLSNYESPDTPHPIAYVSTTQVNSSSQHVCEYVGKSSGNDGTYTSYELSPCGKNPAGLTSPSEQFSFWT
jgi:hypothetical protein